MMGEELARCHLGEMLRTRRGRYYCARCLARLLASVAWTEREGRRAIVALLRWPGELGLGLRHRGHRCEDCRRTGGALLGAATVPEG